MFIKDALILFSSRLLWQQCFKSDAQARLTYFTVFRSVYQIKLYSHQRNNVKLWLKSTSHQLRHTSSSSRTVVILTRLGYSRNARFCRCYIQLPAVEKEEEYFWKTKLGKVKLKRIYLNLLKMF